MKGLLFGLGAAAHMELLWPYPFRSTHNPQRTDLVDYSMTNPLFADGSNFPCKGYQHDDGPSVLTYTAGQTYNITLDGSATHEGGSCQISLSYDGGSTWSVVHSMIGGCPLSKHYTFTIPTGVQSGSALLAWTWFNRIGNREMYMNCARVRVQGGKGDVTLPSMYEANVFGSDTCNTVEGEEVVFPRPGDVEYGGHYAGTIPTPDCLSGCPSSNGC